MTDPNVQEILAEHKNTLLSWCAQIFEEKIIEKVVLYHSPTEAFSKAFQVHFWDDAVTPEEVFQCAQDDARSLGGLQNYYVLIHQSPSRKTEHEPVYRAISTENDLTFRKLFAVDGGPSLPAAPSVNEVMVEKLLPVFNEALGNVGQIRNLTEKIRTAGDILKEIVFKEGLATGEKMMRQVHQAASYANALEEVMTIKRPKDEQAH